MVLSEGQWVGNNGNSNCSDPKNLMSNLMPTPYDLKIESIKIKTFDGTINLNSSEAMDVLDWNMVNLETESLACYELTIPEEVVFYHIKRKNRNISLPFVLSSALAPWSISNSICPKNHSKFSWRLTD